jgi:sec-independent protein translocase protein TatC
MSKGTETGGRDEEQLEEGTMSFLDHLDELRTRLIRCAIFIMVAFVICWLLSDRIYRFLEVPVKAAMIEAKRQGAPGLDSATVVPLADYIGQQVTFTFPSDTKVKDAFVQAGTTLKALVKQAEDQGLELVTVDPWIINESTVVKEGFVIPRTMYQSTSAYLSPENQLVVPTVQGAFNLYIKVAFYAAIFVSVPFLLTQVWGFVAPGLYAHEKRYASPIIVMASVCFLGGCWFAYRVAFPRAASFLLGVAAQGNLRPLVTADDYFDLIIIIMLGLGIVFEIPTVTLFASRMGLVTPRLLLKVWRYAIIVIFIVAAVMSPTTDVPNLLVFALPMIFLYFGSVGISWMFFRRRQTEAEYQAITQKEARKEA